LLKKAGNEGAPFDRQKGGCGSVGEIMTVKFYFNDEKAVEVLAFLASEWDGISPFYVAKVLFFADKWHLNEYGRPIIGDTYIAMKEGPVPSIIRDYINGNFQRVQKPGSLDVAVKIEEGKYYKRLHRGERAADLAKLSETDIEQIRKAVAFCKGKSREFLSKLTHQAWSAAPLNRDMDYENFVDDKNPNRAEILRETKEFAIHGIL
jgi:hypothetical protein